MKRKELQVKESNLICFLITMNSSGWSKMMPSPTYMIKNISYEDLPNTSEELY